MPEKLKKPRFNQGKRLKVSDEQIQQDSGIDYPIFCFKHLRSSHDLSICTDGEKVALIERLATLSKFSWNALKLMPKHGLGSEKIARTSIRPGIPAFLSSDVNFFLSFRFDGTKPFVGHRNGNIFHILWIDRGFDVYNHGS